MKKMHRSFFRQKCPKWSPREMVFREITLLNENSIFEFLWKNHFSTFLPCLQTLEKFEKNLTPFYSPVEQFEGVIFAKITNKLKNFKKFSLAVKCQY